MNYDDQNWMLITNSTDENSQDYYSLLIDKTQIHLAEKSGNSVSRSIFLAKENCLYINNKKVSESVKMEFKKKLNKIFKDAMSKRARVSGRLPLNSKLPNI